MTTFQRKTSVFLPAKILSVFLCVCCFLSVCACKHAVRYVDYVSELRSNVFLAEADGFSLRAYAVKKETPYLSDGAPREMTSRIEVYLVAPAYDKDCIIAFTADGEKYGGEMSFDSVKSEYYFSRTLDVSAQTELCFVITYGKDEITLRAQSVITDDTLSPEAALNGLCEAEKAFFESLTDSYGFAGEIYLRLLYEDTPYYYVGVIPREGKTTAFLLNGKTGAVLAKREG